MKKRRKNRHPRTRIHQTTWVIFIIFTIALLIWILAMISAAVDWI